MKYCSIVSFVYTVSLPKQYGKRIFKDSYVLSMNQRPFVLPLLYMTLRKSFAYVVKQTVAYFSPR